MRLPVEILRGCPRVETSGTRWYAKRHWAVSEGVVTESLVEAAFLCRDTDHTPSWGYVKPPRGGVGG